MDKILEELALLQMEALIRNIAFDIDLHFNSEKHPLVDVSLNYADVGAIKKGYAMNTTFTYDLPKTRAQERFDQIKHFIYTVTGPKIEL